jgi:hypothetical protein
MVPVLIMDISKHERMAIDKNKPEKKIRRRGNNIMNNKEFEAVIKQPAAIRYEYFIKKVVDYEEVWGLYNEGWATAQDDLGKPLIPFFPKREFAEGCAQLEWEGFRAKRIALDDFIGKWLYGMKADGVRPSIFPTDSDTSVVDIEIITRDLEHELENY